MAELLRFPIKSDGGVRRGDPILAAVDNFRAAMEDYNSNAPMHSDELANAYAAASYAGPLLVIQEWKAPARTREGAIAALRLAKKADEEGDYSIVGPMLAAALAFLETED
ncbi:hypothetical protein [Rhizobium lentis]|uniref:Uncharacterized protein n=1 Tax=Rhizobium lentis TaxID=1138194 RepID=A0A7W8UMI0_9HYPH|nr:hypothetical protein [Rhizobium lentis]MBB4574422.1 hypothetical protein [Rhizobium lentis]MBB5550348.1 hypothetical protein [Rhizobium lentis]MBB5560623.1 hypothetical protein [Rhizobium lentis]MBB5567208.1 hypothetical protein [Rhizobium lentis]